MIAEDYCRRCGDLFDLRVGCRCHLVAVPGPIVQALPRINTSRSDILNPKSPDDHLGAVRD